MYIMGKFYFYNHNFTINLLPKFNKITYKHNVYYVSSHKIQLVQYKLLIDIKRSICIWISYNTIDTYLL